MKEFEYIKLEEDLDAPVTWRDLERLLLKLQNLYRQEGEPDKVIQLKEY